MVGSIERQISHCLREKLFFESGVHYRVVWGQGGRLLWLALFVVSLGVIHKFSGVRFMVFEVSSLLQLLLDLSVVWSTDCMYIQSVVWSDLYIFIDYSMLLAGKPSKLP